MKDVYRKLDDSNVKVDENKLKKYIEAAKNAHSANFNANAPRLQPLMLIKQVVLSL